MILKNIKEFSLAYIICLFLSLVWLLILLAGPYLYLMDDSLKLIADYYYYFFHFTCHQMPSRCYWLAGHQLPICVRCLGIYLGVFVALLIYPFFKSITSTRLPRKIWLLLCFLPIGFDGICQVIHLYPSPHWLRLLTGMLCGGIAVLYVVPGLNEVFKSLYDDTI